MRLGAGSHRCATAFLITIFILTGIVGNSTHALLEPHSVQDKHLIVYRGESLDSMAVSIDNLYGGQESFDLRYGPEPKREDSLIGIPITESFALLHDKPVSRTYIYIHGLNSSAYQGRDIGRKIFNEGSNFLAIRLSGHGIDENKNFSLSSNDWPGDLEKGIALAKTFGGKIFLIGFSMGGALAIDRAYRSTSDEIAGVIAVAPAIGIRNKLLWRIASLGGAFLVSRLSPFVSQKYRKVYLAKGLHCLYQISKGLQSRIRANEKFVTPITVVTSTGDQAVDNAWISPFVQLALNHDWLQFSADDDKSEANFTNVKCDPPPSHTETISTVVGFLLKSPGSWGCSETLSAPGTQIQNESLQPIDTEARW